jgi:hypothetical protein
MLAASLWWVEPGNAREKPRADDERRSSSTSPSSTRSSRRASSSPRASSTRTLMKMAVRVSRAREAVWTLTLCCAACADMCVGLLKSEAWKPSTKAATSECKGCQEGCVGGSKPGRQSMNGHSSAKLDFQAGARCLTAAQARRMSLACQVCWRASMLPLPHCAGGDCSSHHASHQSCSRSSSCLPSRTRMTRSWHRSVSRCSRRCSQTRSSSLCASAEMYKTDRAKFNKTAQEYTRKVSAAEAAMLPAMLMRAVCPPARERLDLLAPAVPFNARHVPATTPPCGAGPPGSQASVGSGLAARAACRLSAPVASSPFPSPPWLGAVRSCVARAVPIDPSSQAHFIPSLRAP